MMAYSWIWRNNLLAWVAVSSCLFRLAMVSGRCLMWFFAGVVVFARQCCLWAFECAMPSCRHSTCADIIKCKNDYSGTSKNAGTWSGAYAGARQQVSTTAWPNANILPWQYVSAWPVPASQRKSKSAWQHISCTPYQHISMTTPERFSTTTS